MRSVPACSVADVAEAARLRRMSRSRQGEGALREAGRDSVRRLYVGSYFCGQYFLRQSDALWREAFSLCRRERIPATLVVPVFSQSDLARGCGLVDRLVHDYGDVLDEITANDVGMLAFAVGRYGRSVNVGRLLSKEPRDPRYPDIFESRYSVPVSALLTDSHVGDEVQGVEIDPTHAALDLAQLRGLAPQMRVGVHVPYCFMSTGSVCELASLHRPVRRKFRPNDPCSLECVRCAVGYALPGGARLLKWGRTVFFPNHGCTVFEGEDFRMIVSPIDLLVRRAACDRGEAVSADGSGGALR